MKKLLKSFIALAGAILQYSCIDHCAAQAAFAGAESCRTCHENFYRKWTGSWHALAMRPYSDEFAAESLCSQETPLLIDDSSYIARTAKGEGYLEAVSTAGQARYPIAHVVGGKNIFYFLTPMERGRLQVLPLGYDVNRREWFDVAASAVRHAGLGPDERINWKDSFLTFNTSCFGCHVSQYSTNYSPKTDTYHSRWTEPGVNCESCHGPGIEHNNLFGALKGKPAPGGDLRIISTKKFSIAQENDLCSPCHARMMPLTDSFKPGDRYFDNYDLTALESPDFHPDGRDIGENYTVTGWLMSPCVQSGKLSCMHCHTSSGRYRFSNKDAEQACAGCHRTQAGNPARHSHHDKGVDSPSCVDCHMPKTEFARMKRSDHSMLPPVPAAAMRFGSANACIGCHAEKSAEWADQEVRKWHDKDYQEPYLKRASLIAEARKQDWRQLSEMLRSIVQPDRNEVHVVSLIRLLAHCRDREKLPALRYALANDRSPWVRSTAATSLGLPLEADSLPALFRALNDEYRLVRIRAAAVLAVVRPEDLKEEQRLALERATKELLHSFQARLDDFGSHYNLGNFHLLRKDMARAVASYEQALKLRPDLFGAHVNLSLAHNGAGNKDRAMEALRAALALEPNNAAANLNLGMLLAEQGGTAEAEAAFRRALELEPGLTQAAYNLGVLLAEKTPEEGLPFLEKAYQIRPDELRYGYALAFYLDQNGYAHKAALVLQDILQLHPEAGDAAALLMAIRGRERQGKGLPD